MNTIFALALMFASFTFGLALIAIVLLMMGVGGMPGGMLFEMSKRSQNPVLAVVGFILTAVGQAFVVCAYVVLTVSSLRAFSATLPYIPTWPLWIAALFHSTAVPSFGMKAKADLAPSQYMALVIVGFVSFMCFLIMAFAPQYLGFIYGWIPFFKYNIK